MKIHVSTSMTERFLRDGMSPMPLTLAAPTGAVPRVPLTKQSVTQSLAVDTTLAPSRIRHVCLMSRRADRPGRSAALWQSRDTGDIIPWLHRPTPALGAGRGWSGCPGRCDTGCTRGWRQIPTPCVQTSNHVPQAARLSDASCPTPAGH